MKKVYTIVGLIIILCVVFFIGLFVGQLKNNDYNSQTFYAEIKEINNKTLLVEGLSVNDINFRSKFTFEIKDTTLLLWRGTEIDIADLDEGDNISVTFYGEILEMYPAKINNVTKIQLLDDEK